MKNKSRLYLGIISLLMMILAAQAGAEPGPAATEPGQTAAVQLPAVTTYEELLSAIRDTKAASRQHVEALVEAEKVRAAWEIGKLIETHVLQNKPRASYDKRVVVRLAKDLQSSPTEVWYMLEFARAYPILPPAGELSWSHYRELLALNDPQEREELKEQAVRKNWSRDRLREEVRKRQELRKREAQKETEKESEKGANNEANNAVGKSAEQGTEEGTEQGATGEGIANNEAGNEQTDESAAAEILEEVLTATPGKPGTYRVVKAFYGNKPDQLVLDLGFSNYYRPPGRFGFKEGDIVKKFKGRLKKVERKIASDKNRPRNDNENKLLFTYPVTVIRVIDGDTFTAAVDLGFGFTTVQTLRLRALDTPEIESASGREAKEFLEKTLPVGSDILVRTSKSDKYDRYLADVFVNSEYSAARSDKASAASTWLTKAKYVNQELVARGLATTVKE